MKLFQKTRLTVQFVDYRVTKKVTSPKSTLSDVVTTDALFPPTLIQTESVSVIATDQQSCEMSNLLHGANFSNQILPKEKHVNRDKFST